MNTHYIQLTVAVAVALFAFYSVFSSLIKARLIEDTPTSKIRSASQGYIELCGFANTYEDNQVVAPLTGRPCLWYHYKIERYERSGKTSSWQTLESKTSSSFFTLKDNTGECAIDPRRADVSSSWIKTWRGNSRHPTTTTANTSMLGTLLGGNYRYTEKIIQANDYLYALGMFQSIHAPPMEQQQKQKTGEILNQWKQDYDRLVERFDNDANGALDMEEWEKARQIAAEEARAYVLENYDNNPIHIMSYSPERRHPYLISNQDPKQLSRNYRLQAAGMALLFLFSTGVSVYLGSRVIGAIH